MKSTYSFPTFENLESRLLMSSVPLAALDSVAQSLALQIAGQVSLTGELQQHAGDVYEIVAPASGRMTIDLSASGSSIDPRLKAFDARGKKLVSNNNASSKTHDSRLTLKVKAGMTYYVLAEPNKNTFGAYQLRVSNLPTDDFGNTNDQAKALSLPNNAGSIGGTINYAGDVDVFKVVAGISGKMTVTVVPVAGTPTALSPSLVVGDQTTVSVVNAQASGGASAVVTLDAVKGQAYYVRAGGVQTSQGRYQVQVKVVQPAPTPVPSGNAGNGSPTSIPQVSSAGSTISAQILQTADGLQLLVVGTNGSDTITLSQTAAGLTMTTGMGVQTFSSAFTSVVVYGFDGGDTIRLTNTVTAGSWIDAGAGNDSVFVAGTGQTTILGGDGDDLLVSLGGGKATLTGGNGTDSFWLDSADRVTDASTTETGLGAVHQIAQFYQPFTNDSTSASYVPLTIAGQSLADPKIDGYASGYRNFSGKPLFADGPDYNDVQQGACGDCYYLASLAALAQSDPLSVRQAIAPLGDGTFAVRFYRNGKAVYLRVDADLPVSGGSSPAYAGFGRDGELWVPLMEKAYAFFRYGQNSYSSLWGGWMPDVYTDVFNSGSSSCYTNGSATNLANFLQTQLQGGHAVTMASYSGVSGPIVGNHAYMVKDITTTSQGTFVTVYNPWGVDGTSYDSNYGDGLVTLPIAKIQQCFYDAEACLL